MFEDKGLYITKKLKIKEAKGDDLNVDWICKNTWETTYRYIYYKVQNRQEAEDITQETYAKAIKYLRKQNVQIDNYVSFFKKVSLNVIRDRWRKKKRQGLKVNIDALNPEETSIEDKSDDIAKREWIMNALSQIKEDQRKVIELRIIQGYSVAETAKQMNRKESTVRVIQYRALKDLGEVLKKANEGGRYDKKI